MIDQPPRYAVYFVPAASSDLYRFGSAILGYDCYTGDELPFPDELARDRETWRQLTDEPRRYGFHATLKAPFRLAPSRTEAELVAAIRVFAASARPVVRFVPDVRVLGTFTAIVPHEPCAALVDLASRCTTEFDVFRALMPAEERARRMASGLSERQVQHLDRWGYPYVFDDFQFHMTLTGRVPAERRDATLAMLRKSFAARCGETPVAVDRLGLFKQDDPRGRFRVLCTDPLRTGS